MKKFGKNSFTAFTLAEVLITLGIIGLIAAFTIPVLMNNIQDAQFKTAYKKAYSVAVQAIQLAAANQELEISTGWCAGSTASNNFTPFMTKFDVVKTCTNTNIPDCWAQNETSDTWYGDPSSSNSAEVCFLDKSGMAWCNAGNCGRIYIDTNGFSRPNQYGIDRFEFDISIPGGAATGIPSVLKPRGDYTTDTTNYCPNGDKHPCYYTKWLYN